MLHIAFLLGCVPRDDFLHYIGLQDKLVVQYPIKQALQRIGPYDITRSASQCTVSHYLRPLFLPHPMTHSRGVKCVHRIRKHSNNGRGAQGDSEGPRAPPTGGPPPRRTPKGDTRRRGPTRQARARGPTPQPREPRARTDVCNVERGGQTVKPNETGETRSRAKVAVGRQTAAKPSVARVAVEH